MENKNNYQLEAKDFIPLYGLYSYGKKAMKESDVIKSWPRYMLVAAENVAITLAYTDWNTVSSGLESFLR